MLWESNLGKFINLKQGKMSVEEYTLKFSLLPRYYPSVVSSPRDLMNRFMLGVSELVEKEYHTAIMQDNMDISCLWCFPKK